MRLQQARRTYGQVIIFRHARQIAFAFHMAIVPQFQMNGIRTVDQAKYALQQVIAIGTATDDVQKQVEFGGGGVSVAHSLFQSSATRRISRPSRATTSLRGRAGISAEY